MKLRMIYLILLTFVLTACGGNGAINFNPDEAASAAGDIAQFDLPADYSPEFSASLNGYTLVAYNPGEGHSHLYLIQSETESDGEKLAGMLSKINPGSYDPKARLTVIESRSVSVRDQETTMIISDGVNSDGAAYRQMAVTFQGKGGPALLVLSEPVTRWNQSDIDAFIASID